MAQQAQDTFVAQMDDGTERLVTRGEVLPDSHELVRRDAKGGAGLFRPLNVDGADQPAIKPRSARPAAKPEPPAAARAEAKPHAAAKAKD